MCGDVEINPGPVKSNFPIEGNFHQADEIFSSNSRGRQCVPCCIIFLIRTFMKPFENNEWTSVDLDQILLEGDFVYRFSKLSTRTIIQALFLSHAKMPPFIKMKENFYTWKVKNTYSGSINKTYTGLYPLVNLEVAAATGLSGEGNCCVFICKESAISIYRVRDFFVLFDSHARNADGLPLSNGRSKYNYSKENTARIV
jgi:hypothetical protein